MVSVCCLPLEMERGSSVEDAIVLAAPFGGTVTVESTGGVGAIVTVRFLAWD
jgi:hypothetical protein